MAAWWSRDNPCLSSLATPSLDPDSLRIKNENIESMPRWAQILIPEAGVCNKITMGRIAKWLCEKQQA